ncbi:MAG: tetratricopeptide repeat protein [Acidobacteriia bacterium]|nr:tetratricopeptide repeat protein [Terriglobia bacterium]
MRRPSSIVIRCGDHLGEPLSAIFLAPEQLGDSVIERLRDYFGKEVRVLKAVVSHDRIEVEVESFGLTEESNRLVDAAAGLRANRLYRSAHSVLQDALKLDPFSGRALALLGEVYQAEGRYSETLATLVRAREISGDRADLLAAMGACCIKLERTASAVAYLERALELDPQHFPARRALSALGRKPPSPKAKRGPEPIRTNLK